jgi:eukaryotic-like serine/threonine-protein kinase
MSPARWRQVATIYEAVLPLAPEARAEYLVGACRDDPELRHELESLIAHAARPVLVDQSVWETADGIIDFEFAPELQLGTQIGGYRVGELLGAGGMGQVYRARDMKLQRHVAMKILPAAFVNDGDRVARFLREAQMLASLNHPNIGAIYGFEESGHIHALILELVDGPTLSDRIANGALPADEALAISGDLATPALVTLGRLLFARQGKLFVQPLDSMLTKLIGTPALVADQIAVDERNFAALAGSPAGVVLYRASLLSRKYVN